jgi:RNA polymerase sigma factor (sigma-70 family)
MDPLEPRTSGTNEEKDIMATNDASNLLTHPEVVGSIRGALCTYGFDRRDLDDGVQEVHVKALTAFRNGAEAPEDLPGMKAFCATIAKHHAIDVLRKEGARSRDLVDGCDPDEHTPLDDGPPLRDDLDARRQLAVLAELFREGRMPDGGAEILESIAAGCTHEEVALDLCITPDTVKCRMRRMRSKLRARMAKLGMLSESLPLHVLASTRSLEALLGRAA